MRRYSPRLRTRGETDDDRRRWVESAVVRGLSIALGTGPREREEREGGGDVGADDEMSWAKPRGPTGSRAGTRGRATSAGGGSPSDSGPEALGRNERPEGGPRGRAGRPTGTSTEPVVHRPELD